MKKNKWLRVNKQTPCPICSRPKYCGISKDGRAAICMWTESNHPTRNGGWLHNLDEPIPKQALPPKAKELPAIDANRIAAKYSNALTYPRIFELSAVTGLSTDSLRRLGIGWSAEDNGYSFPMRDSWGFPVGIRLRHLLGGCWAVPGSKSGIFIPDNRPTSQNVLICEGPTDTAAMLDLGFYVIGRPDCSGGADKIIKWFQRNKISKAVIVPDHDRPGWRGAMRLANQLVDWNIKTKVIRFPNPEIKDAREWKQSGVSRDEVIETIQRTPNHTKNESKGSSTKWHQEKRRCTSTPA